MSGPISSTVISATAGGGGGGGDLATTIEAVYRTDLTTGSVTVTFSGTSFGVEIINDSPGNNVAINFSGAAAAIPTTSASLVNNHLVLPKEARYFPFEGTSCTVIASAASTTIRLTIYIQQP